MIDCTIKPFYIQSKQFYNSWNSNNYIMDVSYVECGFKVFYKIFIFKGFTFLGTSSF